MIKESYNVLSNLTDIREQEIKELNERYSNESLIIQKEISLLKNEINNINSIIK